MLQIYNFIFLMLLATNVAGGQTYNGRTHICCNGTLFEKPNAKEYQSYCCGDKLLKYALNQESKNKTVPICCNGKLHENPAELNSQCCGTELYNSSKVFCFQQRIAISIPPEFQVLRKTEVCGSNEENIQFYDFDTQMCCSDVPKSKGPNSGCCHNFTYDTTENTCCLDTLFPKDKSLGKSCCGNKLFNATEAVCCAEYISSKNQKEMSTIKFEVLAYNGSNPSKTACCNGKLYDHEKQICCESGLKTKPTINGYAQCCGKELLTNWTGQICSPDGKIVTRNSTMEALCGSKVYNVNEHFCYNNTLVKRNNIKEIMCDKNGLTYNEKEQICASNSIVNLTSDDKNNGKLSYCEVLKPGEFNNNQN